MMTKPVMGAALLTLDEQGKFRLDDPRAGRAQRVPVYGAYFVRLAARAGSGVGDTGSFDIMNDEQSFLYKLADSGRSVRQRGRLRARCETSNRQPPAWHSIS